ncbi:MAG: UDP-2,3-diacylglucosamine diphosphatase [Flavobacteriaceae bacterium]|nr:UDP-2,3-diacylglucosamine diphosphatase [Flavobacteriaceae bacterium]
MELKKGYKIYFASDNHLGTPSFEESLKREKHFVSWLDIIKKDASEIFLLGDLFDFWFEYVKVVPKGFVRVLGKLAEISDSGIKINFFVGNHDLWTKDYFQKELGFNVYRKPEEFRFNNKLFFIGHGDGLGPFDNGYKFLKSIFTNTFTNFLFRILHPDIGIKIGQFLSKKNKLISGNQEPKFLGKEKEWLIKYCEKKLNEKHRDFFIFGHRHLPINIDLKQRSKYINLGDWISHFTYAVFDGNKIELKTHEMKKA